MTSILANRKALREQCQTCRLFSGNMLPWVGKQQADILFLSDYPRWKDAQRGTFQSNAGQTFKRLVSLCKSKFPKDHPIQKLTFRIGYALQCGIAEEGDKTKPTTTDASSCGWIRNQKLLQTAPRLIVTMGKLATQAVGIQEKNFDNVRGKIQTISVEGQEFDVYPTFHPAAVYLGTGLTKLFLTELENAFMYTLTGSEMMSGNIKEEIKEYEYPRTPEEVKELSERVIAYKGPKFPLSVDTETNSLEMHLAIAKCIAFSVAWDKRKSAAWLLNHKAICRGPNGDPLTWWLMLPYVFNILMCDKPKVAHNFQFDLRVFRHLVRCLERLCELIPGYRALFEKECHWPVEDIRKHEGIRNVAWDTMLAEHALEEDKKGFYSLKSIIRKYEPLFVGYEKTLKKDEFGKDLRTLADFIEYVETLETTKELRRKVANFWSWTDEFMPEELELLVPKRIQGLLEAHGGEHTTLVDAREIIMKSRTKRDWQKMVREWVTNMAPGSVEQKKLAWKNFGKNVASAREFLETCTNIPRVVEEFVWFIWFKKESKRDHLKAAIKLIAKSLKDAMEKDHADINFENFDPEELLVYAAIDTDMTICSAEKQIQALTQEEKEKPSIEYDTGEAKETSITAMKKLSNRMCKALSKMVDTGVKLDYDYLETLERTYTEQAAEMEEKIYELADLPSRKLGGVDINLNSNSHIAALLQHCGYVLTERTATGQIRVTKQILKGLAKTVDADFTVMDAVLLYRESLKARDTFLKGFRKFAESDGRIHPSFHQIGTATYRLSSSRPNFQNIPKKLAGYNVKMCLVPSYDDWCIVNIDASGAEIKSLVAYLAQMKGQHRGQQLIHEMNTDPNFDMHSKFCSYIFGPELWDMDVSTPEAWDKAYHWVRANKDEIPAVGAARGKTKAVVFGTLYGQTAHGLANLIDVPLEEAEFIIKQFFAADPSIGAYVNWSQKFVEMHGYITTILGRRRRFPLARLDRRQLGRSKRQATNFLIQSLTVDVFNYLLSCFIPVLIEQLGGRPLMQVHDALVMEMPKQKLVQAVEIMQYHFSEKVQRDFPWFPVWFKCDVDAGDNYGSMMPAAKYIKQEGLGNTTDIVETTEEDKRDSADVRLRTEEDPDEAHLAKDLVFEQ